MSTDPEDLFPPKPGGMVATARQRIQDDVTRLEQLGEAPAEAEAAALKIDVPVMERGTEFARARTFSVSTTGANPVVELLGRDPDRRYAVILALDEPVVISFSEQAAQDPRNVVNAAGLSANGFTLPVNVPVPVNSTSVIWCTATSSTPGRVSVMAFSYA